MKIVELFLTAEINNTSTVFRVGEDPGIGHNVKRITFAKYDSYGLVCPCYAVTFEGLDLRVSVPARRMVGVTIDQQSIKDKDIDKAPPLPE